MTILTSDTSQVDQSANRHPTQQTHSSLIKRLKISIFYANNVATKDHFAPSVQDLDCYQILVKSLANIHL